MDRVELYRQLLGLTAPWTVEQVELDMAKKHVQVHLAQFDAPLAAGHAAAARPSAQRSHADHALPSVPQLAGRQLREDLERVQAPDNGIDFWRPRFLFHLARLLARPVRSCIWESLTGGGTGAGGYLGQPPSHAAFDPF